MIFISAISMFFVIGLIGYGMEIGSVKHLLTGVIIAYLTYLLLVILESK